VPATAGRSPAQAAQTILAPCCQGLRLRERAEALHRHAAAARARSAAGRGRVDPREAELGALHAEGVDLVAQDTRLHEESAAGHVDADAHRRLRARLRAHRGDLQRFRDGPAAEEPSPPASAPGGPGPRRGGAGPARRAA
jgi:hypothetical protein